MKECKSVVSLFLGFLLLSGSVLRAEPASTAYSQPEEKPNYATEAGKAVVDRVFGVEGDAGKIEYHVFEFTSQSPRNAALRSAVIPGWGQHFNGQGVKGTVLFLCTVGAAAGAVHLYDKSRDSYDEYKAKGVKDDSLYEDYDTERTRAWILGGAALILWGFTVGDAYKNAYSSLYGAKDNSVDIALLDDGAAVYIKKNF